MNGSMVRASSGAARAWRMRQWPHDPTVAHLIFVDHQTTPTSADVAAAVDHAAARGARAVRTSALFPAAADVVLANGFDVIDRLALLARGTTAPIDAHTPGRRIRPLRPWHLRAAAEVDRAAFGPMWGNDATSLRDIRRATPHHRARIVQAGRHLVGFALSGGALEAGYLQRLAVAPTARRAGIARDLVVDALGWMHERGHVRCFVNTGVDNAAALALYHGLGFERLPDVLTIAERRLTE